MILAPVKGCLFSHRFTRPTKIGLVKDTGADCVVVSGSYRDAYEAALEFEGETGAIQLHAYDSPETVAGQGTLFAEWEEQGLNADTVLVAVGGAGLMGGALGWFEGSKKIVAVEPVRALTVNRALRDGPDSEVEVDGIAANALGASKVGRIGYDLATKHGVESTLVEDEDIASAQAQLWKEMRQVVEPGAATAFAALSSGAYIPEKGERVAVLLCGGNVNADPIRP